MDVSRSGERCIHSTFPRSARATDCRWRDETFFGHQQVKRKARKVVRHGSTSVSFPVENFAVSVAFATSLRSDGVGATLDGVVGNAFVC